MIAVALTSLLALLIGVGSERRWGEGALSLSRKVLDILAYVAIPLVVFFTVSHLKLTTGLGAGIVFGWTERAVVIGLAWLIGSRLLKLPRAGTGAIMIAVGLANTGYLGIPLIALLLGNDSIGVAVAYEGARARTKSFFTRNPALIALIAAVIAPSWLSPDWARDIATVTAVAIAPLGFFAVGVYLMVEHDQEGTRIFPPQLTAPVVTALALRLLIAPGVMLGLSTFVIEVPAAFLIQAAMASGITGLAVGHIFGLDLKIIVGAIAWSTAIVVVAAGVVALAGGL